MVEGSSEGSHLCTEAGAVGSRWGPKLVEVIVGVDD